MAATPAETVTTTSPTGIAEQMLPVTITTLVVIALAMVVTIAMILWGRHQFRKRRAAERDMEGQGNIERVGEGDAGEDVAPVAATPFVAPIEPVPPMNATPPGSPGRAIEPQVPVEPVAPPPPARSAATPGLVDPAPAVTPERSDTMVPEAPVIPPTATPPVARSGDLTMLKGLGPKVAARLEELGITRIADLAALNPDQAGQLDAQLGNFRGRMGRDRWIEQARLLNDGDRAGYEAIFGKLNG